MRGKLKSYAERYDLLEVRPVDTPLPPASKLERWRGQVPPSFAFSVVLPQAVGELGRGADFEAALRQALDAAKALQARCLVLATPPGVRPTKANRERLVAIASRLPEHGHVVAWSPAGMWELEDVVATAHRAGLLAALDAARDPLPPGPIAYTRIRALGQASLLGATSIERIALQLRGRREAFVVVDGAAAARVKAALADAPDRREPRKLASTLFRPATPAVLTADDEEQ